MGNKLAKTQRARILEILIGTSALMALLWYFGVTQEQAQLKGIQKKAADQRDKLKRTQTVRRQAEKVAGRVEARSKLLAKRESTLAPDWDAYDWIVHTINPLYSSHNGVRIDACSQPKISNAGILPNFPYRWADFHARGTGCYHEFASFIADLENSFQYCCIENVNIVPNTTTGASPGTMIFNFDLVTPVVESDIK